MNEIQLADLQVGRTYYIHQVKDEATHGPISLKYKAFCSRDYSFSKPGGWDEFAFVNVKGINTEDIVEGLGISSEEDRWGLYKFYLCQKDEIIERVTTNSVLKNITGDPGFKW